VAYVLKFRRKKVPIKLKLKIIITACAAALIIGCGGGGSSTQITPPLTGVFLDSAVSGISYRTQTQFGTTNAAGEFKYIAGEQVTFSVGNIQLPSVAAASVITPLDIAGTLRVDDNKVVNLLVFLQSLDTDGDPSNGITIPASAITNATTNLDFTQSTSTFATLPALIALLNTLQTTIKTEANVLAHFTETIRSKNIQVAPVAKAGKNQSLALGALVTLDGTASGDANGDALTYAWTLTSKPPGSNAALSSATASKPTFTADVAGTYVFSLVVNDSKVSSNSGTVNITVSPTPTYIGEYFVEVPNALTIEMPPNTVRIMSNVVVDINNDGKNDLVVHLFGPYIGSNPGNNPTPNQIKIYIRQDDGTFKDKTSTYIIGSTDLGGSSRQFQVADINGDGKPDIVYSINREDGRLMENIDDIYAQMAALVSVDNKYIVKKFGVPNAYHSVGVGKTSSGQAFVTGAGFGAAPNTAAYTFDKQANVSLLNSIIPEISPNTFEFFSDTANSNYTNLLIQTGFSPNLLGVQSKYIDLTGQWKSAGNLPIPFPKVGTVDFYIFTGEGPRTSPVYQITNGKYILGENTGFAIDQSCKISIYPGSTKTIIMRMGTPIIKQYIPGVTKTIYQGDSKHPSDISHAMMLIAAKIVNNVLVSVPLNIENEQTNIEGSNFSCYDVNGDGYEDIVVIPFSKYGKPIVYLNNKAGGFKYIGQEQFPQISNQSEGIANSILYDFDGDLIPDLLVFQTALTPLSNSIVYHFYKGIKPLR
jgi:hypothetical protein